MDHRLDFLSCALPRCLGFSPLSLRTSRPTPMVSNEDNIDRKGLEGLQVICILPSLFISSPKPEVWRLEHRRPGCYSYQHCLPPGEEEETKAILHQLLPLKVSRRLSGTLGSPFSSGLPSGSSLEPPPAPCAQGGLGCKAEDGQHLLKNPSHTKHLMQRPLLSSWRTGLPCWRRAQG